MGISLTWKREDRIKFGNCGKYLDDIVDFRFPEYFLGGISNEDLYFILNDPVILKKNADDLELPKFQSGYGIQYRISLSIKSREEIMSIVWDEEKDLVHPDAPNRYELISRRVAQIVPDKPLELVFSKPSDDYLWNIHRHFVRWVSEEEYKEMAVNVREMELGVHDVDLTTRLYLMTKEQKISLCEECPMSIDLDEKVKFVPYCFNGASEGAFHLFFEYISEFGDFSVLTNEYMLRDDLEHANKIREATEQTDIPPEETSDFYSIIDMEEISVDELDALEKDLQLSRYILESKQRSVMVVFDRRGKKIKVEYEHHGGFFPISQGYRINVDNNKSVLTLEYTGPNIFNIPEEADLYNEDNVYIFYFSDIYRQGNTFVGRFKEGTEMELPLLETKRGKGTPFRGLYDVETIGRVEHTLISAMDRFGFFQRLFEKYVEVTNKFKIPIQFK